MKCKEVIENILGKGSVCVGQFVYITALGEIFFHHLTRISRYKQTVLNSNNPKIHE